MTANNPPYSHLELSTPVPSFDLVDLLAQYSTEPELLKLILQSKLQEDKRKTEETRLRSMEIDLMMYEQGRQQMCLWPEPGMKRGSEELFPEFLLDLEKHSRPRIESNPFSIDIPQDSDFPGLHDYTHFSRVLTSNESSDTSSPPTIFSALESEPYFSHPSTDSSPTIPGFPNFISQTTITATPTIPGFIPVSSSLDPISNLTLAPNPGSSRFTHSKPDKKKRNRKAMLPISMIVETKEFPYLDNYVWLNNGNTIQKKTGLRSTYYKCASWHRGCVVNKTVSSQGDGTYVIKYRGEHLPECRTKAKASS